MLRKKTLSFFPKILPPFPIHYISLFSHSGIAQKNHYELLGVTRSATQDDIKLVYYDLARKHHPDINKGDEELFKAINSAYETLSDASKRKEYDEVLRRTSYLTPRKSQPNSSGFRGESKVILRAMYHLRFIIGG